MERVSINAVSRTETGKIAARKFRANGQVPAVVYGKGKAPINIAVDAQEMKPVVYGDTYSTHIFDLSITDSETLPVMILEVQRNPISRQLVNVDFHVISLDVKVHTHVPLALKGEPTAIKRGAILERLHGEVQVECLPMLMPDHIEVDISQMELGDAIHASDLQLPPNVVLISSPDEVLIVLAAPQKGIEEVSEEESKEPEVITQRAKEAAGG